MSGGGKTLRERLFSKLIIDPSGCLLWTGSLNSRGYGVISVNGRYQLVHRVMFEMFDGPIPPGLQLDHVRVRGCAYRHCANVAHLEPVTPRENTMRSDAFSAVNSRKTHCSKGHPFNEDNTLWTHGHRQCRICNRAYDLAARRPPGWEHVLDAVMRVAQSRTSFTAREAREATGEDTRNAMYALKRAGYIEPTGGSVYVRGAPVLVWRISQLGLEYQFTGATA